MLLNERAKKTFGLCRRVVKSAEHDRIDLHVGLDHLGGAE